MSWWSGMDSDVYVSMDEAKACAKANLSDMRWPSALRQHLTRPTAVLARHVASPSYETMWFARVARRHGFQALIIEHRSDRFTAHNPAKRSLATLPVVVGRSRNGQAIVRRQKIVDTAAAEGRRLEEVVTQAGESLIDYHHRKLAQVLGPDAPLVMSLQDVAPACAAGPGAYYLEFFKMLSGPLVLFEDFVADEQTAAFFQRTVLPAHRRAVSETGRRPQIARLVPGRRTSSPMWNAYPAAMADDPSWVRSGRRHEPAASPTLAPWGLAA